MSKLLAILLLVLGSSTVAMAFVAVPEIHLASGTNAVALIAACLVILRGRRKQ